MKQIDVITIVLILMEAIIVLVWMDMNWNQIIILVQVLITLTYVRTLYVLTSFRNTCLLSFQNTYVRM